MDQETLTYDILRFDHKERPNDRFLATHLHRFEVFHKPVAIAIVIEILNPWHPTSELGQKIIQNIVREFLRSTAQSFLARFEASLKYANRSVEECLTKLDTSVGCVAVLLEEDQVHCAGIGTAKMGLWRNGRLSTIIGSKSQTAEVFSAVTSGDLRQNDWICLANQAFYDEFEEASSELWEQADPTDLHQYLTDQRSQKDKPNWAGMLLRFNQTAPTINQTTLWEESSNPIAAMHLPKVNLSGFSLAFFNPLLAQLRTLPAKARPYLSNLIKKVPTRATSTAPKTPSLSLRRFIPLIVLAIIVIAGIFTFRHIRHQIVTPEVKPNLAANIMAAPADTRLKTLLASFKTDDYQSLSDADKSQLTAAFQEQHLAIVNLPTPITQAPSTIAALTSLAAEPILVDDQGQVWMYKNSLLNRVEQKQAIPSPISITALSESNIVVTDSTGNIWLLNGTPEAPIALAMPASLPASPKVVTSYKGNLYIGIKDTKAIFRVNAFTDTLSSVATYNKGTDSPLGAISDLAVNGSVLAVDDSGHLINYVRNKLGPISGQLPTIDDKASLTTDEATSQLIVASGRLIYIFDPAGTIQSTVFVAADIKTSKIAVDTVTPKTLWLTLGSQLYHLTLP